MPFMTKNWVPWGAWMKYESRVLRRAWKETNAVTVLCAGVGSTAGYFLQYLVGLRTAHDTVLVAPLMMAGALVGFLFHFLLLLLSAPAKLADEERSTRCRLESELAELRRAGNHELRQVGRRGDAPFLKPPDVRFVRLFVDSGAGRISMIPYGNKGLLCGSCPEVELKDGESVYFPVENLGETARAVSMELDNVPIGLEREPDMQGARGFHYLVYPYQKARHGQEQALSISFETRRGVQDTHLYLLRHGCRSLKRIDPPPPH